MSEDTVTAQDLLLHRTLVSDYLMEHTPILKQRKKLYEYEISYDLNVPNSSYEVATAYLKIVLQRGMHTPILHLYGDRATGKTTLAVALAAFLSYNHCRLDRFPLTEAGMFTFQYIDWPINVQRILDRDYDEGVDYDAAILILDALDAIPTLPKSGDPWQITHLYSRIKPRLDAGKPTILVTQRSYQALIPYLSAKANGQQGDAIAKEQAQQLVELFALRTFGSGKTMAPSASKAAIRGQRLSYDNIDYRHMWPTTTWAGTPVKY